MTWLSHLWWWIEVHTGTVNESGPFYGFWSGFGSDLGEVTLLAAAYGLYRAHNCHAHRCPWIGRHPYEKDGVTLEPAPDSASWPTTSSPLPSLEFQRPKLK